MLKEIDAKVAAYQEVASKRLASKRHRPLEGRRGTGGFRRLPVGEPCAYANDQKESCGHFRIKTDALGGKVLDREIIGFL